MPTRSETGRVRCGYAFVSLALANVLAGCAPAEDGAAHGGDAVLATPTFDLVLSLPEVGRDQPMFHRANGVELTPDGSEIVVLDWVGPSIRIFDWEGELVREFGRRSHGYGDLEQPIFLQVVPDGIYLQETSDRTFNWFDFSGEHRSTRVSRRHLAEDSDVLRTHSGVRVVRHDQLVAWFQPTSTTGARVLVDEEDRAVHTLGEFPSGRIRIRLRSNPEAWISACCVGSGGDGRVTGIGGDSLFVSIDVHYGIVEWRRIERGGTTLIRRRDLAWTPEPFKLDLRQAIDQEAQARRILPSEILELEPPPFRSRIQATTTVAPNGDFWLRRHTGERTRPDSFTETAILVPFAPDVPVREFDLPPNFYLRSVWEDLLLGVHVDALTDEETIQVYRLTW